MDNSLDFYAVTVEDAKRALDENLPNGVKVPRVPRWVRLPPGQDDLALRPAATQWLSSLPVLARPHKCAEHYPRIVNRLSRLWQSPLFVREYLDELVSDKRGEREGFPHGIKEELTQLRDYYNRTYPIQERRSIWDAAG